MKVKHLLFFLSIFPFISYSQNLVSNGTFEQHSTCPNGGGQIAYAIGWINPEAHTDPDYYNICVTSSVTLGIPNNVEGYQADCNGGGAYAALWALEPSFPNDGHEYIQTQLKNTLIQYHKYVATAHISLSNYSSYAVGSIGMYFTPNAIQGPSNVGFMNVPNPQVKGGVPLTDTLNWMAVQDTFVAQGGELYLTIGNFSYDSLSDTLYLGWRGVNGSYYYYIDSVTIFDTGLMGVTELKKQELSFKISPNPCNGSFNILVEGKAKQMRVEVTSLLGQPILEKEFDLQNANTVTIENLVEGVYFIKLTLDGIHNKTQRIIVTK